MFDFRKLVKLTLCLALIGAGPALSWALEGLSPRALELSYESAASRLQARAKPIQNLSEQWARKSEAELRTPDIFAKPQTMQAARLTERPSRTAPRVRAALSLFRQSRTYPPDASDPH